ncbi:MAG: hypothetical protein H8E25_10170 [Planctomycetes bacterium]|nr:hypothetical protein [Planctomycetota bacterium]
MTTTKIPRKALFADGVLWLIAILAGIMFVLPKAVSLIQVREQEKIEQHKAQVAQQRLKDSQLRVEYLGTDPDAIEKINEQRALRERMQNND